MKICSFVRTLVIIPRFPFTPKTLSEFCWAGEKGILVNRLFRASEAINWEINYRIGVKRGNHFTVLAPKGMRQ